MKTLFTIIAFATTIILSSYVLNKTSDSKDFESRKWISLFNGKDLKGWTVRGNANWKVINGVMTGEGGRGHIYADPIITDFEAKGEFRITDKGNGANSGFYFRATAPADDINGFPRGYEAQICHIQDAHTGWLWKPGKPTGKASALLTKDGEWFSMRIKAIGDHIQIWVKDSLVTNHNDIEFKNGRFAIQCHNDKMVAEARNLFYREIK